MFFRVNTYKEVIQLTKSKYMLKLFIFFSTMLVFPQKKMKYFKTTEDLKQTFHFHERTSSFSIGVLQCFVEILNDAWTLVLKQFLQEQETRRFPYLPNLDASYFKCHMEKSVTFQSSLAIGKQIWPLHQSLYQTYWKGIVLLFCS